MNQHVGRGRARPQVLIHGNISAFGNFDLQMYGENGSRNNATVVLAIPWWIWIKTVLRTNRTFLLFFLLLLLVVCCVGKHWLQNIILLDETDSADVGRDNLLLFKLGRMLLMTRLHVAMIGTIAGQSHCVYSFYRFILGWFFSISKHFYEYKLLLQWIVILSKINNINQKTVSKR